MTDNRLLTLPSDPAEALAQLREASAEGDVVVFKKSPTCPISHRAEFEFKTWWKSVPEDSPIRAAIVDVIAERALARGLTSELGIQHESPQALWFRGGELAWHDSHGELTQARFASASAD